MDLIWYIYFVYLAGAAVLIVLFLMHNRKIDKAIYLTTRFALISYPILVAICIAFIIYPRSPPPFNEEYRRRQRRTWGTHAEIYGALKAYHDGHGRYPDSLEHLVPEYLNEIELPDIGDSGWIYTRDDKGGFSLELGYDSYCGLSYPVLFNFVDLTWRRWEKGKHPQRPGPMAGVNYTTVGSNEANGP
jgi:hypothetical protein